jgi:hypothetical protein
VGLQWGGQLQAVRSDRQYADNRALRRDRSGAEGGAVGGGVLGLLLAALVPGVGSLVALGLAVAAGAAAGAVAGRAAARTASVDDWDRNPNRLPWVGTHTPDPADDEQPPRPC